jgi:hypothetical protein
MDIFISVNQVSCSKGAQGSMAYALVRRLFARMRELLGGNKEQSAFGFSDRDHSHTLCTTFSFFLSLFVGHNNQLLASSRAVVATN